MRKSLLSLGLIGLGLPLKTLAETPNVAVDIAPLHSLVSQVMDGVATPELIITSGASPHHYSLRPSQARALSESDIVFWMGEELTPWLEKAIDNVASSSKKVGMLNLAVTTTYPFREGTTFEEHAHHDSEESEHGHRDEPHADDHAEHSKTNEEHEAHHGGLIDRFLSLFSSGHHDHEDDHHEEHEHEHEDENDEEHADHEAHHHDGVDPHAWLDPENAKQWVTEIARVLSEQDPENAPTYQANASSAIVALDQLIEQTQAEVSKLGDLRFVVFHDAYQYFERRFDIAAAGSISLGDAEDPSPARITEIRNTVQTLDVTCVFAEPQFNEGLVKNIFADSAVTRIGVMDPLGADIATGKAHYSGLILGMSASLADCIK